MSMLAIRVSISGTALLTPMAWHEMAVLAAVRCGILAAKIRDALRWVMAYALSTVNYPSLFGQV